MVDEQAPVDEQTVAAGMLALADRYATKANQLRRMAADLLGTERVVSPSEASSVAAPRSPQIGRAPAVSTEDYMRVLDSEPFSYEWTATSLAEAANRILDADVKLEAARTMLYRFEDRGYLVKSGRGTWRRVLGDEPPHGAVNGSSADSGSQPVGS